MPALSSALWTVDITSGPPADQQWQYSLTIDYWDFGLPSYASFPYLDINLDIKEPGTTAPITVATSARRARSTCRPTTYASTI